MKKQGDSVKNQKQKAARFYIKIKRKNLTENNTKTQQNNSKNYRKNKPIKNRGNN